MSDILEGSAVLEALAQADLLDAFYEAVDVDDLDAVNALLRRAGVDGASRREVLRQIAEGE